MNYGTDKVDEMVLALLCPTTTPEGRGWKGQNGTHSTVFMPKARSPTPRARPQGFLARKVRSGLRSCLSATLAIAGK